MIGFSPTDPIVQAHVKIAYEISQRLLSKGIDVWLEYGSLLGAVRDGGVIKGDYDIDLAIWQDDWGKLTEVGAMRVEPVAFRRGAADISDFSRVELDQMADRIQSWPTYYLRVVGHARAEGDKDANLKLAASRSIAVRDYLVSQGVSENRLRAEAAAELSQDAEVSFVLGHNPY